MPIIEKMLSRVGLQRKSAPPTYRAANATTSALLMGTSSRRIGAHAWEKQSLVGSENPLAFMCIQKIASAIAQVRWYVETDEGEPNWNHPVSKLLARPNQRQGKHGFFHLTAQSLAISGNAYWTKLQGSESIPQAGEDGNVIPSKRLGIPQLMRCERPDRVITIWDPATLEPLNYMITRGSVSMTYDPVDVYQLRHWWLNDDYYGVSQVRVAQDNLATYQAVNQFHRAITENGAIPPGAIVAEGGNENSMVTDDDMTNLRETLENFKRGGDLEGKLLLLNAKGGNLNIKPFPTYDESVSIGRQNHSLHEICNVFGIPPILVSVGEGATYENQKEARHYFWTETLIPHYIEVIADALSQFLGVTVKPDLNDIEALAQARESMWDKVDKATFLTINEKREALNYEPLSDEEGGDLVMVSNLTAPLKDMMNQAADVEEDHGMDPTTPDNDDVDKMIERWLKAERAGKLITCSTHDHG